MKIISAVIAKCCCCYPQNCNRLTITLPATVTSVQVFSHWSPRRIGDYWQLTGMLDTVVDSVDWSIVYSTFKVVIICTMNHCIIDGYAQLCSLFCRHALWSTCIHETYKHSSALTDLSGLQTIEWLDRKKYWGLSFRNWMILHQSIWHSAKTLCRFKWNFEYIIWTTGVTKSGNFKRLKLSTISCNYLNWKLCLNGYFRIYSA